MADLHWCKFWVARYLSSETRLMMTAEERGIYCDALFYIHQQGSLPAEPRAIQTLLRITPEEYERSWPAVRAKLLTDEDGRLYHSRMRNVREEQIGLVERRRSAGKASGEARRTSERTHVEHMFDSKSNKPTNEEKRRDEDRREEIEKPKVKTIGHPQAADPDGFLDFWKVYPRKTHKDDAAKAWRVAMKAKGDRGKLWETLPGWLDEFETRESDVIPYPGTFLRRGDWKDQPAARSGPAKDNRSAMDDLEGL